MAKELLDEYTEGIHIGMVWMPRPHVSLGYQAGLAVRRLLLARRYDGGTAVTAATTMRSPLKEIAYFLHHRLRNIGSVTEILEDASEDRLMQTLRTSRARALKSLRTLLDSVLQ